MSDVIIRAEGLGKRYLIGHQTANREKYTTLRDAAGRKLNRLGSSALNILHRREIVKRDDIKDFWALKDVSFELKRGEVVGIIGRNGAGKSTLLKILSRITEPTEGLVKIIGRVASLLEVGTGFHPELTGRENIFLNGAILGMSLSQIRKRFDEIVEFADVEKFIDTPVKRYSSGMYVRLAFSVAAHLDPEILVVDEVLAVGDAEFQKKCMAKMKHVAGHGQTVLFVSHNLAAVRSLCGRGLLLDHGRVDFDGSVGGALSAYGHKFSRQVLRASERKDRSGSGAARVSEISTSWAVTGKQCQSFDVGIDVIREIRASRIIIAIYDAESRCILRLDSSNVLAALEMSMRHVFRAEFPEGVALAPGSYYINTAIYDGTECCDYIERIFEFEFRADEVRNLGRTLHGDEIVVVESGWTRVNHEIH